MGKTNSGFALFFSFSSPFLKRMLRHINWTNYNFYFGYQKIKRSWKGVVHCTDLSKTACKCHCLCSALEGWRWIQCCQQGKAKCGPRVLWALPWLWGHSFELRSCKTRSTHLPSAFVQVLEGGLAIVVTAAASHDHKNQELPGCHRSSGISVPSVIWFWCPHRQPIFLHDFRPSLRFAPWANIYTSLVDMESSNIQQDAQCMYFVQVQFSFQGAGKWNPRLTNRPRNLLTAFFPGLNIFVL